MAKNVDKNNLAFELPQFKVYFNICLQLLILRQKQKNKKKGSENYRPIIN